MNLSIKLSTKSQIFRYFLLLFIAGIAVASWVFIDYFFIYLIALIGLILALIFWSKLTWRYLFLGLIILALGLVRYQFSLPKTDPEKIWFYADQKINFTGIITDEPDIRIDKTKIIVLAKNLAAGQKVDGKVLINVGLYPVYQYGDLLSISCNLKKPEPFSGFAYDRYLAKDDIYVICSYPKISLIKKNQGNYFLSQIYNFKNQLRNLINNNLPEPQASLFFGMNFGNRGGIPQELSDQFSATGTSHLVAISGMNITIIASILLAVFLALGVCRKKSFWLITLILIFYMIVIGFPASAVRAAIMGWLAMLAIYVGRLNSSTNALLLSGVGMIFANPKILRDDVGFQLSFLAVLGLIYFYPFLELKFAKFSSRFGLKESLLLTMAAQISTLPLIVYNFGRLSLISLVVNILVVPTLPALMVIGFLSLFLSWLFPIWGQSFFWPVWLIMTYLIKVIEFFGSLPWAALNL
ncbi:MAG: ComEC/Rec2 family competence protein [Candidatus Buchananbacteria bacterium]